MEAFFPGVVGVDVGEGYDFAAFEDEEFFSELGFASGGKPDASGD